MVVIAIPQTDRPTGEQESMQKSEAVAALGQRRLMLPAWVKAALSANDRLKVYLTVLQTACSHVAHPNGDLPDLTKEIAAAGLNGPWLQNVAADARQIDGELMVPELPRLVKCFADDLATMAVPYSNPRRQAQSLIPAYSVGSIGCARCLRID